MSRPTSSRGETERIVRKYGRVKRGIEQLKKLLSEVNRTSPLDIKRLKVRIIELDKDVAILKEIMEETPENTEEKLVEEINTHFEAVLDIKAETELMIERFESISAQDTNSPAASLISHTGIAASNPSIDNNYGIPVGQLPRFDGRHEEWPSFAEAFQQVIGRNSELRNIEKFSYLKSCLSGQAAEKIRTLEITADNYPIAWKTLTEYYDNMVLINKHVRAILEGPPIKDNYPVTLIVASDALNANYGALLATKKPFVDQFAIFAHLSRLDQTTRDLWEERRSQDTLPTVEEFVVFLRERGNELLNALPTGRNRKVEPSNRNAPTGPDRIRSRRSFRNELRYNSSTRYSARTPISCGICRDKHYTWKCDVLLKAEPEERRKIAAKAQLCLNCLEAGHQIDACKKGRCRKCNGGHHELLHARETVAASATVDTTNNFI